VELPGTAPGSEPLITRAFIAIVPKYTYNIVDDTRFRKAPNGNGRHRTVKLVPPAEGNKQGELIP